MKRKIKSAKGFTLAELLIVVAIIAVLVAIGIPIFTSQLEKSREAVDLSDVRSAYAEVMMAAITGDTTAYYTKDANQTIYKTSAETFNGYTVEAGAYSITVTPLKQKQPGWQTAESITIGGVSSKAGEPYWNGQPGPDGYCIVTYHPPVSGRDEYVSFYWSGGNDSGNPTVTPTPTPWIPPVTPTVTPTPIPSDSGTISGDISSVINKYGYSNWPEGPIGEEYYSWDLGHIYYYGGVYYVSLESGSELFNEYGYVNPTTDHKQACFAVIPKRFFTAKDVMENGNVKAPARGDIFIDNGKAYVFKEENKTKYDYVRPNGPGDSGNWVEIQYTK